MTLAVSRAGTSGPAAPSPASPNPFAQRVLGAAPPAGNATLGPLLASRAPRPPSDHQAPAKPSGSRSAALMRWVACCFAPAAANVPARPHCAPLRTSLVGPGKRTAALRRHEINEAGYLAGRAALADPIDEPGDLRRLVDGNETVHETRTRLDRGRGNVVPDIEASLAASTYRTNTSYAAQKRADLGGSNDSERKAAAALALGAGNCDQNSTIAARLHGPRLGAGESAHVLHDAALRHAWAQIHTPERPGVVMDPWANGPAMQTADTAWRGQGRYPRESFDVQSGPAARDSLLRLAEDFEHGHQAQILADMLRQSEQAQSARRRVLYLVPSQLAGSPYPLSGIPGFGERARHRLQSLGPVHQQVLAAGAARSAYGMNIAAAAGQAGHIAEAAQSLDTMPDALARPPLRKPESPT